MAIDTVTTHTTPQNIVVYFTLAVEAYLRGCEAGGLKYTQESKNHSGCSEGSVDVAEMWTRTCFTASVQLGFLLGLPTCVLCLR